MTPVFLSISPCEVAGTCFIHTAIFIQHQLPTLIYSHDLTGLLHQDVPSAFCKMSDNPLKYNHLISVVSVCRYRVLLIFFHDSSLFLLPIFLSVQCLFYMPHNLPAGYLHADDFPVHDRIYILLSPPLPSLFIPSSEVLQTKRFPTSISVPSFVILSSFLRCSSI